MKLYLSIVAACLVLAIACKPKKNRSAAEIIKEAAGDENANAGSMNFTIQLPQDWVRIDTSMQGLKVAFCMPGHRGNKLTPSLNVTTSSMHGESHEEYLANNRSYLLNNNEDVEMLTDGGFKAGKYKCLWYSFKKLQNGVPRQLVFYTIAVNGISYNITAGVLDGGLQKYKPLFDQIVKSFRLL